MSNSLDGASIVSPVKIEACDGVVHCAGAMARSNSVARAVKASNSGDVSPRIVVGIEAVTPHGIKL